MVVLGPETLSFRPSGPSWIYADWPDGRTELVAAMAFDGIDVVVPAGVDIELRVEGSAEVWVRRDADLVTQTVRRSSAEKFTTLDRPAPMSPEMQAIQRMARENAREREMYLDRIRALEAANRAGLGGTDPAGADPGQVDEPADIEAGGGADGDEGADDAEDTGEDAAER